MGEEEGVGDATTQPPPTAPGDARDQCGGRQEGRLDRILTVLDSMTDMAEFLKVRQEIFVESTNDMSDFLFSRYDLSSRSLCDWHLVFFQWTTIPFLYFMTVFLGTNIAFLDSMTEFN